MLWDILFKSQTSVHGLQLWTNLFKARQDVRAPIPGTLDLQFACTKPNDKVFVKVIASESHSLKYQIYTRTLIMHLDLKMFNNQAINQTIPKTDNRFIYVLNGTAYIGHLSHETETKAHRNLILSEDGTSLVRIQAKDEEANFVQIAEELLKQVVQIDPFGMNTSEEVYESYRGYCNGVTGIERGRM